MRASIVIGCYNYGQYIGECLESALSQRYEDLEVIVVDDGSTDDSLAVIRSTVGNNPCVRVIEKENGGQLSTFNAALEHISGEVVFFLDADDWYDLEYVRDCMRFYGSTPDCDFLCGNMLEARGTDFLPHDRNNCEVGYSAFRTYYLRDWLGKPTSAISMKSHILRMILPLPFESEWRIRADDCLVFGASLIGAKKFSDLSGAPSYYRIHGENNYRGTKSRNLEADYRQRVAVDKLFNYIVSRNCVVLLPRRVIDEFRLSENPDWHKFLLYSKVVFMLPTTYLHKLYLWLRLIKAYVRS